MRSWIKVRPTSTPSLSRGIAVRLRLLNRVVTNLYDERLRPLGLKVSQLPPSDCGS